MAGSGALIDLLAGRSAVRVAEQAAALTLFGYLIAQSLGRSRRAPGTVLAMCLVASALCALVLEVGRGFLPNDQASLARGVLALFGAGFGVFLHGARIDVVRMLWGGPAMSPVPAGVAQGLASESCQ